MISKRIGILGGGSMTPAIMAMLAGFGHEAMVEDKPKQPIKRKQYKPLDMSDFKQPVNSCQAKQRNRKLKRKGRK